MAAVQAHLDSRKSGQVSVYVSISDQRRFLAEIERLRGILVEMNKVAMEMCSKEAQAKVAALMRDLGAI